MSVSHPFMDKTYLGIRLSIWIGIVGLEGNIRFLIAG